MSEFTLEDGLVIGVPIAVLLAMAMTLLVYYIILRIRNPKNKRRPKTFYDSAYRGIVHTVMEVITNLFLGSALIGLGLVLASQDNFYTTIYGWPIVIGGLGILVAGFIGMRDPYRSEWHEKLGTAGLVTSIMAGLVGAILIIVFGIMALFDKEALYLFVGSILLTAALFGLAAWFSYFNRYMMVYIYGAAAKLKNRKALKQAHGKK